MKINNINIGGGVNKQQTLLLKKEKEYSILVMLGTTILLVAFAALVIVVDPFVQYHKPLDRLQTVFSRGTQSYVNPGLAKNYSYNNVIIGSSVSENFYASDFDAAFGGTALKLPFAGGTTMTYRNMLDTVFAQGKVDTVFYSLDFFALTMDATKPRYDMPMYLYDQNLFNDVAYVLNKDVLGYIATVVQANCSGTTVSLNDSYNWEHEYEFSQARVLQQYARSKDIAEKKAATKAYYPAVEAGLENVLYHIKEHPETKFKIFYPPYSILWYDNYKRAGTLEATIAGMARSMDILLEYENVELYFFAGWEDVITDLNNYRESMHFSEKINKRMVDALAKQENRITRENLQSTMEAFYAFVNTFDCGVYYP